MSDIPSLPLGPPSLGIVNDDLTITFKRDLSHCSHPSIVVDAKARTIECGKCHRTMDPFDALGALARDSTALVDERKHLAAEIKRWRMEAEDAQRRRNNAIAAARRKETPEAALLRELVATYKYERCPREMNAADKQGCGKCLLCRARAMDGRTDAATPTPAKERTP